MGGEGGKGEREAGRGERKVDSKKTGPTLKARQLLCLSKKISMGFTDLYKSSAREGGSIRVRR